LNLRQFKEILSETLAQGIKPVASFVIGFPDETKEEVDETIALGMWARNQGSVEVHFNRLFPLAGTKIFHDNKAQLHFSDRTVGIYLPMLVSPKIVNIMQTHPELFSSFYAVATPQLDPLDLSCLANFFFVITNKLGQSIQWVFNRDEKKPTDLFSEWFDYTKSASYQQQFDPQYIVNSFLEYL